MKNLTDFQLLITMNALESQEEDGQFKNLDHRSQEEALMDQLETEMINRGHLTLEEFNKSQGDPMDETQDNGRTYH